MEVRNVSIKYPGRDEWVLKNVSITIPAGRKLSVVGPNGAGKTTFIKLPCRLYEPREGEILLDGVNISNYDLAEYMRLFAVVFQDFKLLAFSMRENIAVSATADEDALQRAVAQAGLASKAAALPHGHNTAVYKTFDKAGVEFSGGKSRKLAIARAIYKGSPIVILDEPIAALDPLAEYEVYTRFNDLVGDKTAIYIALALELLFLR
ncbi:MAG TPA: ATP-binding cassette domain-containing protein [Firmicutes bacterium]|nr:ATP-binding cassette domain-containing protein [Bacillota bacterium]